MLSKEEIEYMKKFFNESITKDLINSEDLAIRFMSVALEYIDQLETKIDELGKGQQTLINSRKKWKNRYYKEKRRRKEADRSVWQIYLDYQDIGKMYFDLDEKGQKLIEKLEKIKYDLEYDRRMDKYSYLSDIQEILSILKGEKDGIK